MFVSKNQFFVFIACIAYGALSGGLFSIFSVVKFFIKVKSVKTIIDVLTFIIAGLGYVFYGYKLEFPDFRLYMAVGVFIGIFAYFKSLHILLAKYAKKFYNRIEIKKSKRKKAENDRSKVKKVNSRGDSRRGATFDNSSIYDGMSSRVYSKQKKRV